MGIWGSIGSFVGDIEAKKTNNYDKYNTKYINTVTYLKSKSQALEILLKQDKFRKLKNDLESLKDSINKDNLKKKNIKS